MRFTPPPHEIPLVVDFSDGRKVQFTIGEDGRLRAPVAEWAKLIQFLWELYPDLKVGET